MRERKAIAWILSIILFVALSLATPTVRLYLPETVGKLLGQTFIPHFWMFLVGAFLSEFKEKLLPICLKYWYVFVLITIALIITSLDVKLGDYCLFRSIFLFLGLLGFAYKAPWLNVKTDISYGVYIYHMTFVNAFIVLGFTDKPFYLIVVTILTFTISYISTKTIGSLSQRMKQKI